MRDSDVIGMYNVDSEDGSRRTVYRWHSNGISKTDFMLDGKKWETLAHKFEEIPAEYLKMVDVKAEFRLHRIKHTKPLLRALEAIRDGNCDSPEAMASRALQEAMGQ